MLSVQCNVDFSDSSYFAVDFLTGQLTLVKSIDVDDADSTRSITVQVSSQMNKYN